MSSADGIDAIAMACSDGSCTFRPMHFKRRALGDFDVQMEMKYCGVCHSDLHIAKGDLGGMYPCVPGHELAGVCVAVGAKVTKFKKGDHVGVGCIVDSCRECKNCKKGDEQYCYGGMTGTYNGINKYGRASLGKGFEGMHTFGGYTSQMVIHEEYAIKIPESYPLEKAGPLMCAAITMYDPLKYFGAGPGVRVGIMGLGGLGMMGVRLAKALGAEVTVISRSDTKREMATKQLGADHFVAHLDEVQMKKAAGSLDLILNTVSADHDINVFLKLLDKSGMFVPLGLLNNPHAIGQLPLMFERKGVQGSLIGGIKATQECMDLCAKNKIYPEIKVVPVDALPEVYSSLDAGNDAVVRYVLDIAGSLNEDTFTRCANLASPTLDKNVPSKTVTMLKAHAKPLAALGIGVAVGAVLAGALLRGSR